ncbi:hypothetical protein ACN08Y_10040 [Rothia sp. P5764]|uniref:hypothetical protein n=1 Tax=Rothia sp. P5764 TaxID=3402654 RepID=UPI003AC4A026
MNKKDTSPHKPPELPIFPVITVEVDDENHQLYASAPGSTLITRPYDRERWVDESQVAYRNEQVAEAAGAIAQDIGLTHAVRVNVAMDDENTFKMWMEHQGTELHMLPESSPEGMNPSKGKIFGGLSLKLWAAITAFILCIVTMVGAILWKKGQEEAAPTYTPPAVQLPVSAPAGWDTFADYSLEATTAAPLIVGDKLLYAQGSELKIANSIDGVQESTHSVGFDITSITTVSGLGENIIAVGGANSQAAIGPLGGEMHTITRPTQQASLRWVSGVPVFLSTGTVWVPNTTGELTQLTAPADSVPAAVFGNTVWMVSTVDTQAWLISSSAPELPAPVSIPAPAGYTYQGFITSVNDHLAFAFNNSESREQAIVLVDATASGSLENGRTVKGSYNQSQVSVDLARNLLLTGSTLVDVAANQAMNVGSNTSYGGGYAWARGTNPQRISVTGDIKTWSTSSAIPVIPADVDSQGRAVVLYKPSSQDVPSKLYVLRKEN